MAGALMAVMIWLEMCGNGAVTGMEITITETANTEIQRDRVVVTIE